MKIISLLIMSQLLVSCLLTPRPSSRPYAFSADTDMEDLEMLLLNEQQPMADREIKNTNYSLRIGMEKNRVKRSLGSPQQVEVAGNPKYENERWIYETKVPTLDGYYEEKQVIYFEGGNVVGWENQ